MKNSIRLLVIISFVCLFNNLSVHAQSYRIEDDSTVTSRNLVLEVAVNSKNYDIITNKLKGMKGLTLVAYCEEARLFLINYNPKIITKPNRVAEEIEAIDPNYKTKIIHNLKFEDIIKDCVLFIAPLLMEVE